MAKDKVQMSEKLALTGFDDIFASTTGNENAENTDNNAIEINNGTDNGSDSTGTFSEMQIIEIPLTNLHPPEFNPFLVLENDSLTRLTDSIREYGVREPGLARLRKDDNGNPIDGYELLIGGRRKRACELAELPTMPVIIRDMCDDDAVIAMVDSNLEQRERLLPSEKAWAYRIKMEAL